MIGPENYEEFLMLYIDGELAGDELEEFERFLAENPHLNNELEQYQLTKMAPDMTVFFQAKATLLQPETKVVPLFSFNRFRLAAALVLLLGVSAVVMLVNRPQEVQYVAVAPVPSKATKAATMPVNSKVETAITPLQHTAATTVVPRQVQQRNARPTSQTFAVVNPVQHLAPATAATASLVMFKAQLQQMQPVAVAKGIDTLTVAAIPAYQMASNTEDRKNWLDRLPLDDLKRQQIDELGNSLTQGYSKVGKFKNARPELSVLVKLEKKKIIVSF